MKMMQTKTETADASLKVAKRLHPEDLQLGDFVAISEFSCEYLPFLWDGVDPIRLPPDKPVRLKFLACDDHQAQEVKSVCLPFVLCQQTDGSHIIHDVRSVQLTRLDSEYAKAVRKAFKPKKKKGAEVGLKKKKKQKKRKK